MAKSKIQKESELTELNEKLSHAKSTVMVDYRGTTVKDINKFRRTLEKNGVYAKVCKVTLLKKALENNNVDATAVKYKAPVILAISDSEETLPAKLTRDLAKEIKTLNILSGVLDSRVVGKNEVLALAELPSKQEMRARLVGTINAPVSGFVNVLAGNLRGLVNVLNAIATK